jgi:hypothetical protein
MFTKTFRFRMFNDFMRRYDQNTFAKYSSIQFLLNTKKQKKMSKEVILTAVITSLLTVGLMIAKEKLMK